MKIEQKKWTSESGWKTYTDKPLVESPQLVLVFGGTMPLQNNNLLNEIREWYPKSNIINASTAGEIIGSEVSDDTLTVTAILFEKTKIECAEANITSIAESESVAKQLIADLPKENLTHLMVFSDGLFINGTALVKGLLTELPNNVSVTGGLVGDGPRFKETLLSLNGIPSSKKVVCIGFYGPNIKIGYGSLGGWDSFGITRTITKSAGNVLYELDNKPALSLYKEYLGELANNLPTSGLLFPLSLKIATDTGTEVEVTRTILAVDEETQSMTFAGDMPEGVVARLMKANFDRLIDGASGAANMSIESLDSGRAELAILISCVGRKLVLKERVEDEVEAVRSKIGTQTAVAGFYSYGEICPTTPTERQCQLHNQTMTITTFREV